jgi:hypothetical protein
MAQLAEKGHTYHTEHRWKRNRFMCYYSVAERCSFQSGNSKEGTRWDTSHKPH